MFKTIKRFLAVPTVADLERDYLETAGDRLELEYRERMVRRGTFYRNTGNFAY
jgi:hypothetical protein